VKVLVEITMNSDENLEVLDVGKTHKSTKISRFILTIIEVTFL